MRQSGGANTVRVAQRVKETLHKIEADHPPHLQLSVITDQSLFINESIGNLATSGIIGGLLAIVVLWIFLRSFRSLFIIALSIPVSIIASFVLVYFSKLSLNLMTLGGLALGVGMLADSSIVVLENIYRHLSEGGAPIRQAAEDGGAREIAAAITASTTTTIAVFFTCYLRAKHCGAAVEGVGLDHLLFALGRPPGCPNGHTHARRETAEAGKTRRCSAKRRRQRRFRKMQARYGKLLNRALSKKTAILAIVLVLVIISVVIYPRLDQEFLPSFDEGFVGVQAMLPAGLSLETTLASIEKIEQDLLRIPEVRSVAIRAGDQGEMDVMSLMTGGMGLENAEFYISLAPPRAAQTIVKADHFEIQNIMAAGGA